jgi:hypothetical protein
VNELQRTFREKANRYLVTSSAATADLEAELARRELAAREGGRAEDAQSYAMAATKR